MKKKTVALEEEFRQLFAIELARIVKSLQNMTLFEFLELCISKNINMDGILPGIDEISLKTYATMNICALLPCMRLYYDTC